MVLAAELNGDGTSIVRVPSADEKLILQVLETKGRESWCRWSIAPRPRLARSPPAKYLPGGRQGVLPFDSALAQFGMAIPEVRRIRPEGERRCW